MLQKRYGDPNPKYFSKSAAIQMGGVLPYEWEAYCRAPFLRGLKARKVQRYKWSVLPYKLEVYCRTSWTSCRGWGLRNIAQFSGGPKWGVLGRGQKVDVEKVYVLFLSPNLQFPKASFNRRRAPALRFLKALRSLKRILESQVVALNFSSFLCLQRTFQQC